MTLSRHTKIAILVLSFAIVALFYAFKNASFAIRLGSSIALLISFHLFDKYFNAKFTTMHYMFIFVIAFTSFLLSPLYYIYPNYDKIQHFLLPILYASIVFHMVDKLSIRNQWKLLFTFFIVVGSLAIFELGEYGLDYFFDLQLQGVFLRNLQGLEKYDLILDRIDDTMIDIVLGVLGSGLYCFYQAIWGYARVNARYILKTRRALRR